MGNAGEVACQYLVWLPRVDKRTRAAYAAARRGGLQLHAPAVTARMPSDHPGPGHRRQRDQPEGHRRGLADDRGDFHTSSASSVGQDGIISARPVSPPISYDNATAARTRPYPALLAGEPVIDITGQSADPVLCQRDRLAPALGPHIAVQPVNHAGRQADQYRAGAPPTRSAAGAGRAARAGPPSVEVYADADRVELLLDGVVVGAKPVGVEHGYLAEFTVAISARRRSPPWRTTRTAARSVRTRSTSARSELRLHMECETDELRADGADLAYLSIALADAAGEPRPLTDREVTVEVSGAGSLLGFGSAEPITVEGFNSNRHTTYQGRALAVVRAGHEPGQITVTANAQDCEDDEPSSSRFLEPSGTIRTRGT